jgi:ribosomal protein S18 acetylase RimI-like enzyme
MSPTGGPLIREATADDVGQLAPLFRQQFELQRQFVDYYALQPDFDWIAFVQGKLVRPDRTIFIVEHDGQLIAYITLRIYGYAGPRRVPSGLKRLWRWKRSTPSPTLRPLPRGVMEDIFVVEACRRQSIAEALVSHAIEWFKAKGIQRVEAAIFADNVGPQNLLNKFGFNTFRLAMHKDITSLL